MPCRLDMMAHSQQPHTLCPSCPCTFSSPHPVSCRPPSLNSFPHRCHPLTLCPRCRLFLPHLPCSSSRATMSHVCESSSGTMMTRRLMRTSTTMIHPHRYRHRFVLLRALRPINSIITYDGEDKKGRGFACTRFRMQDRTSS